MFDSNRFQDRLEMVLGAWLVASPWLLGYGEPFGPAAATASVVGLLVLLLSIDDYYFSNEMDEVLDAVLGLALAASPFVLTYTANARATINAIVSGLFIAGIATWAFERLRTQKSGWDVRLPHF